MSGFVKIKNQCITRRTLINLKNLKFGLNFTSIYKNLSSEVTKTLKAMMESSLHRAMSLSPGEYVHIQRFLNGSLIVDCLVLLKSNSSVNKLNIITNIENDIAKGTNGNLHEYYPFTNQTIIIEGF